MSRDIAPWWWLWCTVIYMNDNCLWHNTHTKQTNKQNKAINTIPIVETQSLYIKFTVWYHYNLYIRSFLLLFFCIHCFLLPTDVHWVIILILSVDMKCSDMNLQQENRYVFVIQYILPQHYKKIILRNIGPDLLNRRAQFQKCADGSGNIYGLFT